MACALFFSTFTKKNTYLILAPVLINIFFASCRDQEHAQNEQRPVTFRTAEIHIELQKAFKQRRDTTVNVAYDGYFNSSKKYLGYEILPLIDSTIKSTSFDTTKAVVIFECTDGYKPTMPLAKLYGLARPYVVYKDLNEKGKKNWPDSIANKFNPYYLVWDSVKKGDDSFSWPYGLVKITLSWADIQDRLIYPANNLSLIPGFNLFHNNCMKCHSLNGVGGSMAPEFNVPKNITEYWRDEDIIAFAKNPKSYRRTSMMPPVTNLDNAGFGKILAYLKYIKNYKVISDR